MSKLKMFEEFSEEERQKMMDDDLTYISKTGNYSSKSGIIFDKIKNYNFQNFKIVNSYETIIIPDIGFRKLLSELNNELNEKIDIDIEFNFNINQMEGFYNEINYFFVLPDILRGLNIGYKLYKLVINHFNYITSRKYLTNLSKNIWYKLMIDADFYCFTSNDISGVIYKNISDNMILEILEKIKDINKYNIIYDSKLTSKINKFYGTIDNYKNKK